MSNKHIEDKKATWNVFDIPVYGTITTPFCDKCALPAVVFIAGSGPTDRNWCSPLFSQFEQTEAPNCWLKTLANRETFVRYDKLASGPHVRENIPKLIGKISSRTTLKNLKAQLKHFSQKNVDNNNLFVLTNSEGAIHAVNYSTGKE